MLKNYVCKEDSSQESKTVIYARDTGIDMKHFIEDFTEGQSGGDRFVSTSEFARILLEKRKKAEAIMKKEHGENFDKLFGNNRGFGFTLADAHDREEDVISIFEETYDDGGINYSEGPSSDFSDLFEAGEGTVVVSATMLPDLITNKEVTMEIVSDSKGIRIQNDDMIYEVDRQALEGGLGCKYKSLSPHYPQLQLVDARRLTCASAIMVTHDVDFDNRVINGYYFHPIEDHAPVGLFKELREKAIISKRMLRKLTYGVKTKSRYLSIWHPEIGLAEALDYRKVARAYKELCALRKCAQGLISDLHLRNRFSGHALASSGEVYDMFKDTMLPPHQLHQIVLMHSEGFEKCGSYVNKVPKPMLCLSKWQEIITAMKGTEEDHSISIYVCDEHRPWWVSTLFGVFSQVILYGSGDFAPDQNGDYYPSGAEYLMISGPCGCCSPEELGEYMQTAARMVVAHSPVLCERIFVEVFCSFVHAAVNFDVVRELLLAYRPKTWTIYDTGNVLYPSFVLGMSATYIGHWFTMNDLIDEVLDDACMMFGRRALVGQEIFRTALYGGYVPSFFTRRTMTISRRADYSSLVGNPEIQVEY